MAVEFKSHQVDILFNSDPICAGTLISSYLVLTVFSCLKGRTETGLKVRTSQKDAAGNFQTQNVETIHSFPALKSEPSENDIAVILLDGDFNLDDPLRLTGRDSNQPDGFIALSLSNLSSSSCGSFPVEKTEQSACNRTTDNPNSICVKPSNQSSCPFPGVGSGLICQVHGIFFLCGALAGNGTNSREYTDISKYLHWIQLTFDTHLNGNGDSELEHELDGAVFGGREVSSSGVSSSIPYQLSLQRKKNEVWEHICGAVIIDEKTVLTAAHCFVGTFNRSDFQVVAGVTHLNSTSSLKQILPLQRIIRHHRFNSRNIFKGNDIAILHVNGSFVFNENVGNIWISPPNGTNSTDFPGRVSGWGQISGIKKASNSLQEADMRILPDCECNNIWSFLKSSMICSFDNVSNVCYGDSGGPLVIQNYQFNQKTKRDLLVGIASFSNIDCEKREMPNGFTEVSHFLEWIKENRALKCGASEFQCFNGQCIHECSLCNGADECGDGSTEKQCEEEMDVTKLKHCARKNQQELKKMEGKLERTEEKLKDKSQVEQMLQDFAHFLAPNQTETNEIIRRDSGLQVLVEKYENGTNGAMELIQTMDNTLTRLDETEEELKNLTNSSRVQAETIRELEQKERKLELTEKQLKNETVSQNQTINRLKEEANRTLIQLEEKEKDVKKKARRIRALEGKLKRAEEQLRIKTQAEEMLLDFLNLLAPNETETNEMTIPSPASRLQVLVVKHKNKTAETMNFIQRVNNTLLRLEETEEELKNKARKIEELEQEKDGLEFTERQLRNETLSQNEAINILKQGQNRTLIQLEEQEKNVGNQTQRIQELKQERNGLRTAEGECRNEKLSQTGTITRLTHQVHSNLITLRRTEELVGSKDRRIQFLEENEGRLEKSVKEWQNLTISQMESLKRLNEQMKNLNETLSQKGARCPFHTHLNGNGDSGQEHELGFPTTRTKSNGSSLAFSSDLYEAVKESQPQNFILSPLSVRNALAMLSLGAKGGTAREILNSLKSNSNSDLIRRQSNLTSSLKEISSGNSGIKFVSADKIYAKYGFRLNYQYENAVTGLGGEIETVDFGKSEEAARNINSWVKNETEGKIEKLVDSSDLSSQTSLFVLNTIYFKGSWKNKFDNSSTQKRRFFINVAEDGCSVNVSMMTQKNEFQLANLHDAKARVLRLPYQGERLSMLIYLPYKNKNDPSSSSLDTLENWLKDQSPSDIQKLLNQHRMGEVSVSLPKFKIRSSLDLNEPLKKLGLTRMFNEATANFSGIFVDSGNLFVSKVKQETFIEVNEEGTEAAAATGLGLRATSFSSTPEFTVNRPFLFQIVDRKTKTVLFSGRIKNPLDSGSGSGESTASADQTNEPTCPTSQPAETTTTNTNTSNNIDTAQTETNCSCEGSEKSGVQKMLIQFCNFTSSVKLNSVEDSEKSLTTPFDRLEQCLKRRTTEQAEVLIQIQNLTITVENLTSRIQELDLGQTQRQETGFRFNMGKGTEARNTTTTEKISTEKQENFPPAAAYGKYSWIGIDKPLDWNFDSTINGSCFTFDRKISYAHVSGSSCVALYQDVNCTKEAFLMNITKSSSAQDIRISQDNIKQSKSIGVCS